MVWIGILCAFKNTFHLGNYPGGLFFHFAHENEATFIPFTQSFFNVDFKPALVAMTIKQRFNFRGKYLVILERVVQLHNGNLQYEQIFFSTRVFHFLIVGLIQRLRSS